MVHIKKKKKKKKKQIPQKYKKSKGNTMNKKAKEIL